MLFDKYNDLDICCCCACTSTDFTFNYIISEMEVKVTADIIKQCQPSQGWANSEFLFHCLNTLHPGSFIPWLFYIKVCYQGYVIATTFLVSCQVRLEYVTASAKLLITTHLSSDFMLRVNQDYLEKLQKPCITYQLPIIFSYWIKSIQKFQELLDFLYEVC